MVRMEHEMIGSNQDKPLTEEYQRQAEQQYEALKNHKESEDYRYQLI